MLNLQERRRWLKPNHNIKVGDVVLLKTKAKRNQWPLGRIVEASKGSGDLVRRVKIMVSSKNGKPQILERSVRDTVFLSYCE